MQDHPLVVVVSCHYISSAIYRRMDQTAACLPSEHYILIKMSTKTNIMLVNSVDKVSGHYYDKNDNKR